MPGERLDARGNAPDDVKGLLLEIFEAGYSKKSWHGPNLRAAVIRVTAEQAVWRPGPDRHSIAELVLHAAYWKYVVRRRLKGEPRGSFALKGSNWFAVDPPLSTPAWKAHLALLDAEHRELREAIRAFPSGQLEAIPPGAKTSHRSVIHGIAAHDVYHAGQIQLLKRLQAS